MHICTVAVPQEGRKAMQGIRLSRFPAPDDIGRELAARLREQVLLNSAEEASHTPPPPSPPAITPAGRAHRRLMSLIRGTT